MGLFFGEKMFFGYIREGGAYFGTQIFLFGYRKLFRGYRMLFAGNITHNYKINLKISKKKKKKTRRKNKNKQTQFLVCFDFFLFEQNFDLIFFLLSFLFLVLWSGRRDFSILEKYFSFFSTYGMFFFFSFSFPFFGFFDHIWPTMCPNLCESSLINWPMGLLFGTICCSCFVFRATARELQTCTFQGPGLQSHSTKRHPREDERMKIVAGKGKKARNFGPPTLRGPTFFRFGPTLRGPTLRDTSIRGPSAGLLSAGQLLGCLCCFALMLFLVAAIHVACVPVVAVCVCCCFWAADRQPPPFSLSQWLTFPNDNNNFYTQLRQNLPVRASLFLLFVV